MRSSELKKPDKWVSIDKELLTCPIDANADLLEQPVITPLGQTYSRANLNRWVKQKQQDHHRNPDHEAILVINDPVAGAPLNPNTVRPNNLLKMLLQGARIGQTKIKIKSSLLRNPVGNYFQHPVVDEQGETKEAPEIKAYQNFIIRAVIAES